VAVRNSTAFAVWITGLPSSGKSSLAAEARAQLTSRGIDVAILESDELRKILTPEPRYDEKERDAFYRQMVYVGTLLTTHGVPVIFDATANRRSYREMARQQIPRFIEVYLDSPLELCVARDTKAIYRQTRQGEATTVPGLQAKYEVPEHPELVVHGDRESPESAANRLIAKLIQTGWVNSETAELYKAR